MRVITLEEVRGRGRQERVMSLLKHHHHRVIGLLVRQLFGQMLRTVEGLFFWGGITVIFLTTMIVMKFHKYHLLMYVCVCVCFCYYYTRIYIFNSFFCVWYLRFSGSSWWFSVLIVHFLHGHKSEPVYQLCTELGHSSWETTLG